MTATAPIVPVAVPRTRSFGVLAIFVAVVCFSISSTLVKKAATPGPTIAFWRMVGASLVWTAILWASERRTLTRVELRKALVPGIAFGLNLTMFFTASVNTTIANTEFIAALTPIVIVPAGVMLFRERIDVRTVLSGVLCLLGLPLVLFFAESGRGGDPSWFGNALAFGAMTLWCTYLLSSRSLREHSTVAGIMAAVMPIASLTVLPIVAVKRQITEVTTAGVVVIAVLVISTGVVAHGLIVLAQRTVPLGTISLVQVSQPAIATVWSVLLLGATLRPVQLVGMLLVLAGLALVMYHRAHAA